MSAKTNEIPSNCCWIYHSEFTKKLDNLPKVQPCHCIGCRLDRKANFYFTKIIAMLLLCFCFCFCFLNCWVTLLFSFLKTEIDVLVSYEILRHFEQVGGFQNPHVFCIIDEQNPLFNFFLHEKKAFDSQREGLPAAIFLISFLFSNLWNASVFLWKLNYPYSNSRNGFLLYLFLSQE